MKALQLQHLKIFIPLFFLLIAFTSCSISDKEIKADIASKAKREQNLLGVRYTVKQGVVTLEGDCPTPKAKSEVEEKIKGIHGVKSVINNIQIAPVVVGTDFQLKRGVDSVLKKYPTVNAIVIDSTVALHGEIKQIETNQLLSEIQALKPVSVASNLIVSNE